MYALDIIVERDYKPLIWISKRTHHPSTASAAHTTAGKIYIITTLFTGPEVTLFWLALFYAPTPAQMLARELLDLRSQLNWQQLEELRVVAS